MAAHEISKSGGVLQQLREGDEQMLRSLYEENRDEFVHWLQRTQGFESNDAREVFQLAVVTLYDNVLTGKLTQLEGSVKTYLFGIGKNKARDIRRKKSKVSLSVDAFIYDRAEENVTEYKAAKEELFDRVDGALQQMGDACRRLIELFYYQKLSMEAICQQMEYSSAATAKNMKYKCLKRLRKMVGAAAVSP